MGRHLPTEGVWRFGHKINWRHEHGHGYEDDLANANNTIKVVGTIDTSTVPKGRCRLGWQQTQQNSSWIFGGIKMCEELLDKGMDPIH